ncbi:substrate-binding domain-containing protein [Aliiglaciecola sp. 2_MG-2023]|uniref:substrate-binding domain-containing protein n=1 Tax=unclassified Aliiglaciecola TaxID=2593648 RepID=UPI0026E26542|nr:MULTISPECIES: substrate-binding domain-containing protein [unclassified Aliiglaciecola]MDO6712400.1 substrate-binding domain-containing protein [Aliiglaciecola sp. 2_MG-2023]MDO6753394.1 substrate-binding domain-containing protein [Aliiglaciecola sp. 1_MG-2023]
MSKNKAKRTTLQDIADVVGMTKMTVSRYMKNPNLVKVSSRIQIESAINKLGYIPNRAPNILSKGKSHAIGVLFPSISNHVFDEVLRGIESVTEPAGYQIMIAHYSYSKELEEKRIGSLLGYHVDGLILSENVHTANTLRMISSSGVPVTEIMDTCTPPIQQAVGFNNMQASQKMTEKLIQKGYKNIAYIGAKGDVRDILRQRGYEAAIAEHALKSLIFRSPDVSSIRLGSEILDSILRVRPKVDAAICTNDDVAMGVLLSCKKKGILIPDELAVSGMHGHEMGQLYSPKLASVITPRFNIGKVAAEQLLSRIDGVQVIDECIDLGFEINDGESI